MKHCYGNNLFVQYLRKIERAVKYLPGIVIPGGIYFLHYMRALKNVKYLSVNILIQITGEHEYSTILHLDPVCFPGYECVRQLIRVDIEDIRDMKKDVIVSSQKWPMLNFNACYRLLPDSFSLQLRYEQVYDSVSAESDTLHMVYMRRAS